MTPQCRFDGRRVHRARNYNNIGTTQRYMPLSSAAVDAAIRLLETGTETSRAAVEK